MKEYKIEIASPIDRDNLVAEIWFGDEMIAEINQEGEFLELEIYSSESKLSVNYQGFVDSLIQGKRQLKTFKNPNKSK